MTDAGSILVSTKKILGLGEEYTAFDLDVMTHINTCFFTLNQLGVGPEDGFMIEDKDAVWTDFTDGVLNYNAVKTYVYLRVRLLFDPPGTVYHINAIKDQITELEYRLKTERELSLLSQPLSPPVDPLTDNDLVDLYEDAKE